jgi:hypothetical protein
LEKGHYEIRERREKGKPRYWGGFGKRLDWEQVVARDAILSVMKTRVGVASSHDHRGKMPLPQKKNPTLVEGNNMRDHYYPSAFSLNT